MPTLNLTALETKLLRNIVLNDYQPTNGNEPESFADTSNIWSNCLDCGPEHVEAKSIPGIVASLSKKGLVTVSGSGKEATLTLTEAGYAAYVAARDERRAIAAGLL